MTNEQILKKAIEKAKKNGYKSMIIRDWLGKNFSVGNDYQRGCHLYYSIIFSHDFAKAFWGDRYIGKGRLDFCVPQIGYEHKLVELYAWQHHLQQMVLEEEPLKYIEKHI